MAARGGRPLLLLDLAVPRDIEPDVRRAAGRHARRHRRPAGPGAAHARRAPGRGAPRRGHHRGGDPRPSPAGSARSRSCRRSPRCAPQADDLVAQHPGRERRPLGGARRARPRADRGDAARRRQAACCTSRRAASALDRDRRHARLPVLRELFGLDERAGRRPRSDAPRCASCGRVERAAAGHARQRAGARPGRWVAERLDGEAEVVEIATAGDLARPAGRRRRQVALDRGARARAGRRRDRPRGAQREGRPGRARRGHRDRRGAAARGPARRARRRAVARRAARGRPRRDERAAPARAAARRPPDLEVVELRGNVDTRLRKLAAGEVDALVLAAAAARGSGATT